MRTMKELEGKAPQTFKLIGGPCGGETFEAIEPKTIIKCRQPGKTPPRYCVYMRKMDTTEYHHITGCCNKGAI
ncbi:hypothetical protein HWB99_gp102 [Mycobacterium phage DrLupo]|uniref:Uncharacterized protein n=1 Tax=Mycobacterium phage DrLupo TaxID=2499037 RepID=A0A3S9UQQ7_9CAUD|nr:hypothetical protein HWB99_gp102 [Mycobacterium phage DrLupo]AZS12638.1 hypothetical protein SEA_DRLUPO_102 [Mycobacterium phage DrLupo]